MVLRNPLPPPVTVGSGFFFLGAFISPFDGKVEPLRWRFAGLLVVAQVKCQVMVPLFEVNLASRGSRSLLGAFQALVIESRSRLGIGVVMVLSAGTKAAASIVSPLVGSYCGGLYWFSCGLGDLVSPMGSSLAWVGLFAVGCQSLPGPPNSPYIHTYHYYY